MTDTAAPVSNYICTGVFVSGVSKVILKVTLLAACIIEQLQVIKLNVTTKKTNIAIKDLNC